MPIRLKLSLWYGGVLAVIMAVFSGVLYFLMDSSIQNQYRSSLQQQTEQVYKRLEYSVVLSLRGWNVDIRLDDQDTFFTENIYLQLYNLSSRKVSLSSKSVQDNVVLPMIDEQTLRYLTTESRYLFTTAEVNGVPFIIYNRGIYSNNVLIGVLQAAIYSGNILQLLEQLRFVLIVSSIIIIVLSSSFGWFLAKKALRPIGSVIEEADKIQSGEDLSRRIPYKGPLDEIGRLAQTINGMLERIQRVYTSLEEAYRNQRRFVSDASHELRTPLTTIRGNVELMGKMWNQSDSSGNSQLSEDVLAISREAMADISAEAERMSRLVNDLLSLARADAGQVIEKEPVELLPVVEEVARRANFLPRSGDVVWRTEDLSQLSGVVVNGSRDYLQQLLFIFIENAFKYTLQGEVVLGVRQAPGQIGISVRDTGIGLDKDEVPLIFERFYRADPSRGLVGGTGLGLSIAKWILDEHGGSVEVYTRKGHGSTFVIWLPVLEQESGRLETPDKREEKQDFSPEE
jgi:signal transduction histidine kinase